MDPTTCRDPGGGERNTDADRRQSIRYQCGRLVVIRLPGTDGAWRWYWVTDVSAGGLAVSFLTGQAPHVPIDTTLLDVDAALSFTVSVRPVWRREETSTRTGFEFVRTDPGLATWTDNFGRERCRPEDAGDGRSLWGAGAPSKPAE